MRPRLRVLISCLVLWTACDGPPEVANCGLVLPESPILSNGFGFDPRNTRNAASPITSENVSTLQVRYALGGDTEEKRGAPAVTQDELFYYAGDDIVAVQRSSGCRLWSTTLGDPASGQVDRPRSSSLVLGERPARGGRLLYVGSMSGNVYALDAGSGATVWRTPISADPQNFITGGMQLHDGRLYVPVSTQQVVTAAIPALPCCESRGAVVALDALTGELRWTFDTVPEGSSGGSVWSAIAIDAPRNQLLAGVGQNLTAPATDLTDAIVAVDLETGQLNWSFQGTIGDSWNLSCLVDPPTRCPMPEGPDFDFGAGAILADLPDGGGQVVIAGDKAGTVFSLDPATGRMNWSRQVGAGGSLGGIHWGLAVDATAVYATVSDLSGDKTTRLPFRQALGGSQTRLVAGATPGVYKLDLRTGEILWSVSRTHLFEGEVVPSAFSAAVSVTNDVVFAASLDGILLALRASDGAELWSFDTRVTLTAPDGSPVTGGTPDSVGAFAAGDTLLLNAGYTTFGGRTRFNAGPGNALFVFELAGS